MPLSTMTNIEIFNELKNHHKALTEVAAMATVSTQAVRDVLRDGKYGKKGNHKIITAACIILKRRRQEYSKQLKAQEQLVEA